MSKRGRTKGIFFDKESRDIRLNQFYNDDTLNIFSDASFIPGYYNDKDRTIGKGCYSCIATCKDKIIDQRTVISSFTTVPESELKGIRNSLSFANIYRRQYKYINIFSDSLYSINAIKNYAKNCYKYSSETANINLIMEIHELYTILEDDPNCMITLYHQSGHISTNNFNMMREAAAKFMRFNNLRGHNDVNFIRYISNYNNTVDNDSRLYLHSHKNEEIEEPILFNLDLLEKDKEKYYHV